MNLKKICAMALGMAVALGGITSCSFQSNNIESGMAIRDVSASTTYLDIVTKGYMGGSLIYNESDEALGQLADGVSVAIRLSKAERRNVSDTEAVFQEQNGSAVYGLLMIDEINAESISLRTELYDITGNVYLEKSLRLNRDESADLNDDGYKDIEYVKPTLKRCGYENALYLNFLSSQEDLNITMYAVLPEQYPGKAYPNGIIGVNNDGKFVVQKYVDVETSQRSVITGVYKGDYIVDNKDNQYQRVATNQYARNARSVNDSDLVTIDDEVDFDSTLFQFTEEDFAFYSVDEFLNALPPELVNMYPNLAGIEKLNKILECTDLFRIVDETQGSILPDGEKEEIFRQFEHLSLDETIQLNRIFLEKNYPISCPQRVTVSTAITEVLPLASIVFTDADTNGDIIESSAASNIGVSESSARAISDYVHMCESEVEYKAKLEAMEKEYTDEYKEFIGEAEFKIPLPSDDDMKVYLALNDTKIGIGIKGAFSSTWGSIKSSLGAAVFFKVSADVEIVMEDKNQTDELAFKYKGTETEAKTKSKEVTVPIIKKSLKLYEYELCQSTNIANFSIGPILIGINLDLGIGLPINTDIEIGCNVSYSAFLAGMAKAGLSVGADYGVRWKKKWFLKIPVPYVDFSGDASSSVEAICYYDQNFETLKCGLDTFGLELSTAPYVKAGLSMSVAAVLHGGFSVDFGEKGYVRFGYYNPYLKGSYGMKETANIKANVLLGLKGLKVLGIDIGDFGFKKSWPLVEHEKEIIPETPFFQYKVN